MIRAFVIQASAGTTTKIPKRGMGPTAQERSTSQGKMIWSSCVHFVLVLCSLSLSVYKNAVTEPTNTQELGVLSGESQPSQESETKMKKALLFTFVWVVFCY